MVRVAARALVTSFAIAPLAGETAWATCTSDASNNVTCTGATTGVNDGYGTGGETGIIVVVGGASVTGTARHGINIGGGTVTNNAFASIMGAQDGIAAEIGTINVINSGSITGTGVYGIFGITNAVVTNNAGATITGGGYGIIASGGGSSIFNAGTFCGGIAAIQFDGSCNKVTLAPGSVV
jgi:hypothetical protein